MGKIFKGRYIPKGNTTRKQEFNGGQRPSKTD
jgi:hypothetical protein